MAKVVEEEGTDLVIVGKQSIDGDYGQTAQMLATQLDWAQGTSLYSVSTEILETCYKIYDTNHCRHY